MSKFRVLKHFGYTNENISYEDLVKPAEKHEYGYFCTSYACVRNGSGKEGIPNKDGYCPKCGSIMVYSRKITVGKKTRMWRG